MAKRRRTVTRSHGPDQSYRPGFSRGSSATPARPARRNLPPPSARNNNQRLLWIAGGVAAVVVIAVLVYAFALSGSPAPGPGGVASANCQIPVAGQSPAPPAATPLASPPSAPLGDGTTATITTDQGAVTFELFCGSAPVAAENFIGLAQSGFYNGVVFHRLVPGFMIQGGDPQGNGQGGPGYTIADEPVVGDFSRGMVAMARTSQPHSEGSQFFILVKDSPFLAGGGYTIFGRVTSGMDVVDKIVSMPTKNDDPGGVGGTAINPVVMRSVTIQPSAGSPGTGGSVSASDL